MDKRYESRDPWFDAKGWKGWGRGGGEHQSRIAIANYNITGILPRRVCLFSNNSKTGRSNIYFWADSYLAPCNYRTSPHRPLNPVVFNRRYSNRYNIYIPIRKSQQFTIVIWMLFIFWIFHNKLSPIIFIHL